MVLALLYSRRPLRLSLGELHAVLCHQMVDAQQIAAQRHGRRADSFTSQINNGLGPQRSTTRERAPIQADARSLRRLPRTTTRYVPGGKVPTPVVENVAGAPADEQK